MPQIDTALTVAYVAYEPHVGMKTGDAGNHTLRIVADGTASTPTNSPAEIDATNAPGIYKITITAGENSGAKMALVGKSSTSNVIIAPVDWANKSNVTQVEGGDATNAVNAEVLDVMDTDTFSELASAPAADATLTEMLRWLFTWARNQVERASAAQTLRADDAATEIAANTVSDDGTTLTRGEYA